MEGFEQHAAEAFIDGVAEPSKRLLAHPFQNAEHHDQVGGDDCEHGQRIGAAAVHDPIVHLLDEDRRCQVKDRAEKAESEQREICGQQGPQFVKNG